MNGNEGSDKTLLKRKRLIRKTVIYNGQQIVALYDPGANASYISYKIAKRLKLETENLETPYQLIIGEDKTFVYNNEWITKRIKAYDL